jgi:hypothetical protein
LKATCGPCADVYAILLGRPVDAQLRHSSQTVVTDIFASGAGQCADAGERLGHARVTLGKTSRRVHTNALGDVVCFQGAVLPQEVNAIIEHVEKRPSDKVGVFRRLADLRQGRIHRSVCDVLEDTDRRTFHQGLHVGGIRRHPAKEPDVFRTYAARQLPLGAELIVDQRVLRCL